MANYNQVTLIGRLTRETELRFTPKGTAVAKVGMAINRTWTDETGSKKEEVTFVDIDLFGKTAENVAKYMSKGGSMLVVGRLKLSEWTDKQSGQKRQKLGVIGETVQFLGSKSDAPKTDQPPRERPTAEDVPKKEPLAGDGPPESDDVPF